MTHLTKPLRDCCMIEIKLPWPPKELNPNRKFYWAEIARHKRTHRAACAQATTERLNANPASSAFKRPHLHMVFYPPNRRRRDWDNLVASMKAGLDGVSDALGIDDHNFKISLEVSTQLGGYVNLTITEDA